MAQEEKDFALYWEFADNVACKASFQTAHSLVLTLTHFNIFLSFYFSKIKK